MLNILETSTARRRAAFKEFTIRLLSKTVLHIEREEPHPDWHIVDLIGRRFIGGDKTVIRIDFSQEPNLQRRLKDFATQIEKTHRTSLGVYVPYSGKVDSDLSKMMPNVYIIDRERIQELITRFLIKITAQEAKVKVVSIADGRKIAAAKPKLVWFGGRLYWIIKILEKRTPFYLVDVETGKISRRKLPALTKHQK